MLDLMQFPDINAPTPQGQVQQMKEYLFQFVQRYNRLVQEVDKQLSEIKERDNGNIH